MTEWRELVERGIVASRQLSGAQWTLGDLALEVEPMGDDHARTGAYGRLERYAELIDVAMPSLLGYRKVAAAWPESTRVPTASWTVHRDGMGHRDLLRELAATHNRVTSAVLHRALNPPDVPSQSPTPQRHAEPAPASARQSSSDDPRSGRSSSHRHAPPDPTSSLRHSVPLAALPTPDDESACPRPGDKFDRPAPADDMPAQPDPDPLDEPQPSVPDLVRELARLADLLIEALPEHPDTHMASWVLPSIDRVEIALLTVRERFKNLDARDAVDIELELMAAMWRKSL